MQNFKVWVQFDEQFAEDLESLSLMFTLELKIGKCVLGSEVGLILSIAKAWEECSWGDRRSQTVCVFVCSPVQALPVHMCSMAFSLGKHSGTSEIF